MFTVGQIVFSKNGRDKGVAFIIIAIDGEYAYLVDGDRRPLEKPKKKKSKHIQITNDVSQDFLSKLEGNVCLLDADVRKVLLPYKNAVFKGSKEVINLVKGRCN